MVPCDAGGHDVRPLAHFSPAARQVQEGVGWPGQAGVQGTKVWGVENVDCGDRLYRMDVGLGR